MTRFPKALVGTGIGLAQVAASIAISTSALAAPTSLEAPNATQNQTSKATLVASSQLALKSSPAIAATTQTPMALQTPIAMWNGVPTWMIMPLLLTGGMLTLIFALGLVVIKENQVGVVVKKVSFTGKQLPADRLVAMEGEAGYQADTLAPGWHWGYWPWQFSVKKEPVVVVPQGQIALIIANDGRAIAPERILGKVVPCDDYQDARKFLNNGGEKGRQLGFLTAGTYRINKALFTVITADNAQKHGMQAHQLMLTRIKSDMVGIVTTLDGRPIDQGEIAGSTIPGHDNFQNGHRFMQQGGRRGLQEQILLSGSWNLNPWFVQVEQVPMTEVPIGYVGVVISYVGQAHEDISGDAFTHGDLVHRGHKGVWTEPLYPGKHPINTRVMSVELVPTTNIVLNWSGHSERHHYDEKLTALTVLSHDGFTFDLETSQIIHVGALDAPKVISRVGSMQNLVDHVLEPTIGNYFRNSAQDCTVLDFLNARSDRQSEAADFIKVALRSYDVQAIDTLIGDIHPPEDLMTTQTDRKIAEEQRKTYEVQQMAQNQRQQLVRETSLAEIQEELVRTEENVKMAELQASSLVKQATGEAESTRLKAAGEADALRSIGQAKADAYQAGVESLGSQNYTAMQLMQIIGERNVRVIPEILVGQNSNGGGLSDALLSMLLWSQTHEGQPLPVGQQPTAKHRAEANHQPELIEIIRPETNGHSVTPMGRPIAPPSMPPQA